MSNPIQPEASASDTDPLDPDPPLLRFMTRLPKHDYHNLPSNVRGAIISIRMLDLDLRGDPLKQRIAEMLPRATLFSSDFINLSGFYIALRDFLNTQGCNLVQHTSHRVNLTLAHELYEEADERAAAIDIVKVLNAANKKAPQVLHPPRPAATPDTARSHSQPGKSRERIAHNVVMRFKDGEAKFSGALGECWTEFLDSYNKMSRDCSLNEEQKRLYLHNLLRQDALRFYSTAVEPHAATFQIAADMIAAQYNSPVRQAQVLDFLDGLSIEQLVATGLEESAALRNVYAEIVRMSPQLPSSHKGDEHRIRFMRRAVSHRRWSYPALQVVASSGLSFQQLYGELEAALQLHREGAKNPTNTNADGGDKRQQPTFEFVGQGRFKRRNFTKPGEKFLTTPRRNPLDIAGCFNCDDKGHMARECPNPLNLPRAIRRKMEYLRRKGAKHPAQQLLVDICLQTSEVVAGEEENVDEEDSDAPEVFTQLLQSCVEPPNNDQGEELLDETKPIDMGFVSDSPAAPAKEMYKVTTERFLGACADSGAQCTVIGKEQAAAYSAEFGTEVVPRAPTRTYRFGSGKHRDVGTLSVHISVTHTHLIEAKADVVDVDIPLLLGFDALTGMRAILDFASDRLECKHDGWMLPLTRKLGHLYVEWSVPAYFTQVELRHLHRHFRHPTAERLHAVIRRAEPLKDRPKLLRDLREIQRHCEVCQREAQPPSRFRVALPKEDDIFNAVVCLDLMKVASRSVLHVVDKATKFGAARFIPGESVDDVWNAFDVMWVQAYVGTPDAVATDSGSVFTSSRWAALMRTHGFKHQISGVEGHNALGEGERYHSFLRRVFQKVKTDSPSLTDDHALAFATKAVNDTAGPNGLVPTLLLFGVLPRLPLDPQPLPDNLRRMEALKTARAEMSMIIAAERIRVALRHNVPAGSDTDIRAGDLALWYRKKPIGRWAGPFLVIGREGTLVRLDNGDRQAMAPVDQVKRYMERTLSSTVNTPEPLPHVAANVEKPPSSRPESHIVPAELPGAPSSDLGLTTQHDDPDYISTSSSLPEDRILARRLDEIFGTAPSLPPPPNAVPADLFIVKILKDNEPRAMQEDFIAAKRKEVDGLARRKLWRKVSISSIPPDANVLGGRFVYTLKNYGMPNEMAKVRYVAQGYGDKDKPHMVHDASNLRASSIRVILFVAATLQFRIWSRDVTQAHLQSKHHMTRDVFIRPKREDRGLFGLGDGELLKLVRPLYGMCDAGDYWGITVHEHNINDLRMLPAPSDQSLYVRKSSGIKKGDTIGVCGCYVDDALLAGTLEFERVTEATLAKFESKPRVYYDFDFYGCQIKTVTESTFSVDQRHYASSLNVLPSEATFEDFRRVRALFSWLVHTRPDIACLANQAAQVTPQTFSSEKTRALNKGIVFVLTTPKAGLHSGPLDAETVHLRAYADASYASNDDLSSQVGYIILLADERNRCHILEYSSRKSKRIVRSIMGGETCAFLDAFDAAYAVASDLRLALGKSLEIRMSTDSKQLFDALVRGKRTTERRLTVEIASARESYRSFEISRVGLVKGSDNPADGLTKVSGNGALERVLHSKRDLTEAAEWIERTVEPSTK